jgi:alpha-beta hydrolase superfamily lysophospholipase
MGGLVSLAWTETRQPPLTGLVLSAPWLATAVRVPAWKTVAGRIAARVLPFLPMDSGTRAEHVTSDPEMIAEWEADPLVHPKISPRLYVEVERWQERLRARASAVKVPTLILVPGEDLLADAQATRSFATALSPETTDVLELPGFRHEAFNERGRADVMEKVVDWIDGHLS